MSYTLREDIPNFKAGDVLSIFVNVREGQKVRQQLFKGTVIARKGSGIAETITVRKMSNGIGVERIFPPHSPSIASIKVDRVNKVRRAKLYYLRDRTGKSARIAEKIKKNIGIDVAEQIADEQQPDIKKDVDLQENLENKDQSDKKKPETVTSKAENKKEELKTQKK